MKALFVRVIEADDKSDALQRAIADTTDPRRFEVSPWSFASIPGAPFAYWANERARQLFRDASPFEGNGRTAKQGLATADDFRFVRFWTEVAPSLNGQDWFPLAKGGEFSRHYCDVYLVVNWARDGAQLRAMGKRSRVQATDFYFRPGLTWPRRTNGLSFRLMAGNCIFGDKGPAGFVKGDDSSKLLALCALMNSAPFGLLVSLQLARTELAQSYEVGLILNTPVPALPREAHAKLATLARKSWSLKRRADSAAATTHAFVLPSLLRTRGATLVARARNWADEVATTITTVDRLQQEIDRICFDLYGLGEPPQGSPRADAAGRTGSEDGDDTYGPSSSFETNLAAAAQVAALLSWVVGVVFGRFDVRFATGSLATPSGPGPFDPLPVYAPGMVASQGVPSNSSPERYPVKPSRDGMLVDDVGADGDLVAAVREVFEVVFDDPAAFWDEAREVLRDRGDDFRDWFAREFFDLHVKQYSRSRRKAPIYWQLATPTATFSTWLYYHRLSRDTLFRLLNDHVLPKVRHEEGKLADLTQEAGENPGLSQRREIDSQDRFVAELHAFRDEVARVAPLWNPNLNDGVIINFAPLWRLVPQNRSWQRECKKVWDGLVDGRYDWAHLAMHLWPQRVVSRCVEDRSLAIAHGLEDVLWEEDDDGKWQQRTVSADVIKRLVAARASAAVGGAVDELLNAPAPKPTGGRGRRRRRTGGQA